MGKEDKKMKYVPYIKLSKKEKRAIDNLARNSWYELNPVTRISGTNKYNRTKNKYNTRKLEQEDL